MDSLHITLIICLLLSLAHTWFVGLNPRNLKSIQPQNVTSIPPKNNTPAVDISPSQWLDFLLIVGKLKTEKRTGWVNNNVPQVESISDHMYRMAVMAFFMRDGTTNASTASTVALVHDIAEALVGDITPPDSSGISVQDKHAMESKAIATITQTLPASLGTELSELYKVYEVHETTEGKLCKQLDKLEMIIQAYEYELTYPELNLSQFYDSVSKISHPFLLNVAHEVIQRRKTLLAQRQTNVSKKLE